MNLEVFRKEFEEKVAFLSEKLVGVQTRIMACPKIEEEDVKYDDHSPFAVFYNWASDKLRSLRELSLETFAHVVDRNAEFGIPETPTLNSDFMDALDNLYNLALDIFKLNADILTKLGYLSAIKSAADVTYDPERDFRCNADLLTDAILEILNDCINCVSNQETYVFVCVTCVTFDADKE